jgi:septation ring formation regulator EzrA
MSKINIEDLTPQQKNFVHKYQRLHSRLEELQKQMKEIEYESKDLIKQLEELRDEENKLFNDGEK